MAVKSINLNNTALRASLLIVALVCVLAVYFAVRWSLASTLAQQTEIMEIAAFAAELSPSDPKAHYAMASLYEKTFLTEDFPKALEEYERAASLAPDDFRLWFDLGKARDRFGDEKGAERAYRKAAELAPHYSRVHWALGNFLLRQGSIEEAFTEIRKAVENDPKYANPAVNVAWQYFDADVQVISQKIGDSIPIKSALSAFLAGQQRFDEAFVLWNTLSPEDKKTNFKAEGEALLLNLIGAKKYRDALSVQSQISETAGEPFALGKIHNSGFEADVKIANAGLFEWSIADGQQPQILFDATQKHQGDRSLVIVFRSLNGQDFRGVQQTVAVESGKRYVFETFARADLDTQTSFKWEIVDTANGQIMASTNSIPAKSDWAALTAEFTTAPDTQAITIRLARIPCPNIVCPISGKIWFDDFNLK